MQLHYLVICRNHLRSDINVSQGNVATYARSGGILITIYCKFTQEPSGEKKLENWLKFDRILAVDLWPHFFGPPCTYLVSVCAPVQFTTCVDCIFYLLFAIHSFPSKVQLLNVIQLFSARGKPSCSVCSATLSAYYYRY